ncbi:hypothetical protein HII31_13055 [Pseudocercospora fuligena]|uniref:F-box domain-containing protein n=1 Tax=Pseudocercospora fuligena TaxID=685502 RepID=A0A8H6R6P6_9PEZI|nr:hypothetical protein HII31_13055 [Pseudocercospora fuligena]
MTFQYISKLEELDRQWTFRFMDLPPEMRNLVYEALLTRDWSPRRKAFLAILRVSKEVYKEAVGIFNDVNTARFGIGASRGRLSLSDPGHSNVHSIFLNGDIGHKRLLNLSDQFDVKAMLDQCVPGLARMRHVWLPLRITWHLDYTSDGKWTLPTSLIGAFVATAKDLRTLAIAFMGNNKGTVEQWVEWLLPLAHLPSGATLELESFEDETKKQEILRQIKAARPKIDAGASCT